MPLYLFLGIPNRSANEKGSRSGPVNGENALCYQKTNLDPACSRMRSDTIRQGEARRFPSLPR